MFSAVLWFIPPIMIFDNSIHGPSASQRKQKESTNLMRKINLNYLNFALYIKPAALRGLQNKCRILALCTYVYTHF